MLRSRPLLLLGVSLVTLFRCTALARPQDEILELSEAVTIALRNHPLVRFGQLEIRLADNRVAEARAARLPTVQFSETITRGNNPVFVFGSLLEQSHFGPENFSLQALNNPEPITNLRTSLSASFPVFDGMRTSARIAQASSNFRQARFESERAEQQVRFQVIRDYSALLVAEAALEVTRDAVGMAESDVQRARDRLEAGLAVESDLLVAGVQLAEFRQQQIQAEGNTATALAALNISIGVSPTRRHRLAAIPGDRFFEVPGPDELLQRAMQHRPEYRSALAGIEFATNGVTERRAEYLPELSVFSSVGASSGDLTSGSMDYAVGVELTLDLFDRGRAARLNESRLRQQTAQTEQDRLADQIRLEVIRAYYSYRTAEGQLNVAEATLAQAIEALRIIQDRYEEGLTTITDVLRAETAVVRARLNATSSRESLYVGFANVLLATGELVDVDAFRP